MSGCRGYESLASHSGRFPRTPHFVDQLRQWRNSVKFDAVGGEDKLRLLGRVFVAGAELADYGELQDAEGGVGVVVEGLASGCVFAGGFDAAVGVGDFEADGVEAAVLEAEGDFDFLLPDGDRHLSKCRQAGLFDFALAIARFQS